ncbi:hypothetical protein EMPS_01042 [Entomortierella parvispora]|uniref:Uncharacterized protein n=1 Tax=Entomortierella parvispora TaxID=205924 RepID=A0A9P3LS63_9FUNG|nr:hypothetical protein EMPS_01042 [Entomortierella parvispora]
MTFFLSPVRALKMADISQSGVGASTTVVATFTSAATATFQHAKTGKLVAPRDFYAEAFCCGREQRRNQYLAADDDFDFDELVHRLACRGAEVLCNKTKIEEVPAKIQRLDGGGGGDDDFCSARAKIPSFPSTDPTATTTLPFAFSCLNSTFMAEINQTNESRVGHTKSIQEDIRRSIAEVRELYQLLCVGHTFNAAVLASCASSHLATIMSTVIDMISAIVTSAAIFSAGQDQFHTAGPLLVSGSVAFSTVTTLMRALTTCATISNAIRPSLSGYSQSTGAYLMPLHLSQAESRSPPPGSQAPACTTSRSSSPATAVKKSLSQEIYDLVAQSVQPLSPRRRHNVKTVLQQLEKTMLHLTVELAGADSRLSKTVSDLVRLILSSAIWAVSWTHISQSSSYLFLPKSLVPFDFQYFRQYDQWGTRNLAHLLKVVMVERPRAEIVTLLPRSSALIYHWMEWFRGVYGYCSIENMTHHYGESWVLPVKDLYDWKKKLINSVLLEMLLVQDDPSFIQRGLFRVNTRAEKALETVHRRIEMGYGGSIEDYVNDLYPSGHRIPPSWNTPEKVASALAASMAAKDRKRKSI